MDERPPELTQNPLTGPSGPEQWVIMPRLSDQFSKQWSNAFSRPSASKYEELWERAEAVRELRAKSSRLLSVFADGQLPSSLPDLRTVMLYEITAYKKFVNRVVKINHEIKRVQKLLADCERDLRSAPPELDRELGFPADRVRKLLAETGGQQATYWERVLSPPAAQEDRELIELFPYRRAASTFDSLRAFSRLHYPQSPAQERQLDTRFQVRIGCVLRSFENSVSLLTIARLVLLTYLCADLVRFGKTTRGDQEHDSFTIAESKPARGLNLRATYEKLRDAGLR